MQTGLVAWFAQRHGKRSVVRIASDLACIPGRQLIRYRRDRWIYEYGLRHATLVAAQTQAQRQLLRRHYGLDSAIVNMAVEVPAPPSAVEADIDVLWLANLRSVKRPEWLLELAKLLPHRRFVLAGGPLPGAHAYFDGIARAAAQLSNVRMTGATPYRQTGALFERARLHVNTSSAEGFPNTFLQAWARGVPVVSFFDPDDLIRERRLGRTVATLEEMAGAVEALLRDEAGRRAAGQRARAFVQDDFDAGEVARQYLALLEQGTGARSPRPALALHPAEGQERAHV
jgi:glycosyltransferase involved in cell wall biosynthesis